MSVQVWREENQMKEKEGERTFLPPRGPIYSGAALSNSFSVDLSVTGATRRE